MKVLYGFDGPSAQFFLNVADTRLCWLPDAPREVNQVCDRFSAPVTSYDVIRSEISILTISYLLKCGYSCIHGEFGKDIQLPDSAH